MPASVEFFGKIGIFTALGDLAQLVERLLSKQDVRSSTLLVSRKKPQVNPLAWGFLFIRRLHSYLLSMIHWPKVRRLALIFSVLGISTSATPSPDWGVYKDIWGEWNYPMQLQNCIHQLGYEPHFILFFRDLRMPFPKQALSADTNILFIASLELHLWSKKKGNYLNRIIQGDFDNFFRAWAKDAAIYGRPIGLRFGFEMNGNWFGWGKQPEAFKTAWMHVHKIFAEEKATKVIWIFAPNVLFGSQNFKSDILPYYPGDSLVDWVALDGYNFGDQQDAYHHWQEYDSVFTPSLKAISFFHKPILISEIGCADDSRKFLWMQDFLKKVEKEKNLLGFIYFNYDKRSEGEPNWALDSDPKTFRIFQDWIQSKPESKSQIKPMPQPKSQFKPLAPLAH